MSRNSIFDLLDKPLYEVENVLIEKRPTSPLGFNFPYSCPSCGRIMTFSPRGSFSIGPERGKTIARVDGRVVLCDRCTVMGKHREVEDILMGSGS